MFSSYLVARNTVKFYQKRFVTVSNEIDLANGLKLTTGFDYEKRNDLENLISYNLFNKIPSSNRPHGQTGQMPGHEAYIANFGLQYTPRHYYTIRQGQKQYLDAAFPTFRLQYSKGFPMGNNINASFDKIAISAFQNIQFGLFDKLFYAVNVGTFLSSKQIYFPDYKHFQTNELFITENLLDMSFAMENYRSSTNDKWLQAHVSYTTQYLLIKQIPAFQRFLFDEAIHLKTLWTPVQNHNEAGYSIGLGDIGRIGVMVTFSKLKYENVGFFISFPLLNLSTR